MKTILTVSAASSVLQSKELIHNNLAKTILYIYITKEWVNFFLPITKLTNEKPKHDKSKKKMK